MSFRETAPVENRSRSLPTTLAAEAHRTENNNNNNNNNNKEKEKYKRRRMKTKTYETIKARTIHMI
jgi:hypothetical protein